MRLSSYADGVDGESARSRAAKREEEVFAQWLSPPHRQTMQRAFFGGRQSRRPGAIRGKRRARNARSLFPGSRPLRPPASFSPRGIFLRPVEITDSSNSFPSERAYIRPTNGSARQLKRRSSRTREQPEDKRTGSDDDDDSARPARSCSKLRGVSALRPSPSRLV